MISTRPHRSWPLIREAVCRNMKPSIELAVKPYYPAKIRQQIFFPDRKLVQFDSGKLQTLSNLLRQMKAGGHKCLIFTQMSKMLDILEVFLNLHAHTYVRLDGSTGTYTDDTYTLLALSFCHYCISFTYVCVFHAFLFLSTPPTLLHTALSFHILLLLLNITLILTIARTFVLSFYVRNISSSIKITLIYVYVFTCFSFTIYIFIIEFISLFILSFIC